MMADEVGNALQRTLEVTSGEHAYFFDRWWQQRAILLYFKVSFRRLPQRQGYVDTNRQPDRRSSTGHRSTTRTSRPTPATRAGETQS
jgi:hypothetical protein